MKSKVLSAVIGVLIGFFMLPYVSYSREQQRQGDSSILMELEADETEEQVEKMEQETAPVLEAVPVPETAVNNSPKEVSLGEFRITAYCGCRKCNGKWYGYPTKSGTDYVQGRTIAVYEPQIPMGSQVVIDGHTYTAEDTGAKILENCIDIYFDSHEEALEFGVQEKEVWLILE